tara:strand:- start:974 stop:1462 length:489 start_codon:yes stop_codon:yes gene_type:complete
MQALFEHSNSESFFFCISEVHGGMVLIRIGKYENASDSFSTPQWVLDMFPRAFDPCPFNPEWDETHFNGLVDEWPDSGLIFINPPYSNVMPWIERAFNHKFECNMKGSKVTIVMLLKHDSSTKWFAKLQECGAKFLMFQGRLAFENADKKSPCGFPSILAVI